MVEQKLSDGLETRFLDYNSMIADSKVGFRIQKASFSQWPKEAQVWLSDRLTQIEEYFNLNNSWLGRFISQRHDALTDLTKADIERYGLIRVKSSGLELIPQDLWRLDLRGYLSEILAGNFSNAENAVAVFEQNSELFSAFAQGERLPIGYGIAFLKQYHQMIQSPAPPGRKRGIVVSNGNETQIIFEDEARRRADSVRNYLDVVSNIILKYNSGMMIKIADLDETFFSRFHTHRLGDAHYFPSLEDRANSHLAGPNVLFSQNNGFLRAYSINRGESRQVYEAKIRN